MRAARGSRSSAQPAAASTSALPTADDTARLPCLATAQPVPATTHAAAVLTLNVLAPSPPVPQVSTSGCTCVGTRTARSRITRGGGGEVFGLHRPHRQGREQAAECDRVGLAVHCRTDDVREVVGAQIVAVRQITQELGNRGRIGGHDSAGLKGSCAAVAVACARTRAQSSPPWRGEHGLGVELDADPRQLAVAQAHHELGRSGRGIGERRDRAQ